MKSPTVDGETALSARHQVSVAKQVILRADTIRWALEEWREITGALYATRAKVRDVSGRPYIQ